MRLSPKTQLALDALDDAAAGRGMRKFGEAWPGCDVVLSEQWRKEFYLLSTGRSPEAKKKAFQRARKALTEAGVIQFHQEHVWRRPVCPG